MLNRRRTSSLLPVLVALGSLAYARPASADVVPPSDRRTTWNPGLNAVGGIPSRTTIFRTLSPSGGDDTAAINAALAACPANQVVKLNPGDFRISGSGLEITRSNVTLRGSGTSTRLLSSGMTQYYPIIIVGNRWTASTFLSSVNLAANGIKGSRTLTVASAPSPALTPGEIVLVDQLSNDNLTVWGTASPPGHESRGWFSRFNRPIAQILEVESVNGTTVTFTTPLHIDFLTAYNAQLSRYGQGSVLPAVKWSGIEDLYVEKGSGGNINLTRCAYCWVKNVEAAHSSGAASVGLLSCFRSEIRDSYVHTSDDPNPGGGGYLLAVDTASSDNLIENNIVLSGNKVIVMRASGGGNVIGYNYMDDGYISYAKNYVESGLNATHMTTSHMELFEGNQAFNFDGEWGWGNAIYITAFRNHLTGVRRSLGGLGLEDVGNRRAIGISINQWWYSFVGNILGTAGQTLFPGQGSFVYESTYSSGPPSVVPMWMIGYDSLNNSFFSDATTLARTFRHGNFDYVTNSVAWDPANADHTLPASLYLTSKPAFFGANPWPWVDPTGATKLYTLPARSRHDAGNPNPTAYALTVTKAGTGSGTVTSSPAGISCGADCSEPYNAGTVVTLSQAATTGSTFAGWSGACMGTGACQITMAAAKSVTATFTLNTFTLTVAKAGTGAGTVTSSPAGINCGADCSEPYTSGTIVTISQSAAAGSSFAGWSGACTGTGACQVTINAAKSVTATFTLSSITFTLTVVKAGTGAGTVTSSPAGINCGADCSEPYTSGTVVILSQAATAGSTFTGWSGACTGTGACQVTVDAAKSVTATFTLNPLTLTVAKAGTGAGTVTSSPAGINCGADCSEPYTSGTVVTLSQAATAGSTFTGWSGACTGTGACQVTVDAAKSVTATFTLNPLTLTVAKAGTGAGTVTSSPAGINCGADCSQPYTSGTVVTLSQAAAAGSTFTGWSGACTGTGACQVTMDAAKSVTATFTLNPLTLTVAKAGTGAGTVTSSPAGINCGADCSEPYTSGTVVTLSQAATAGSTFTGWSGACTGTGACQITMDAAKSVTATFTLSSITFTLAVAKAGTGAGTVTSSPAGINCGADCSELYNSGTVVTLSQAATTGSTFTGWSGACTGTGACQVSMDAAKSVTATFTLSSVTYTLAVTKAGTGSGTVTSSPAGIGCPGDCSEPYSSGTLVTLSQSATAGSTFTGWSGSCTGTGACQVTLAAAKSVTATFTLNATLTVARAGTGTGTVTSTPAGIDCGADCSESYGFGSVVTLSQTATAGSTFTGWTGSCAGTGACQVTIAAAKFVTATFTLNPNLTVVKAGTGTGTVTSSPAGIDCGADCSEPHGFGSVVTLSQAATAGSTFTGWSGACTGTGACQITMAAAKSVTATFTLNPNLTVVKAGSGTGTVTSSPAGIDCGADCSEPFSLGSVVTLSQAATAESTFTGWSGACTGTGACQITMAAAKAVTATFALNPLVTSVDLRVSLQESADPAQGSLPLTYTLTSRNAHATRTATNVVAKHTLPASFSFASAGAGCALAASQVTCALGSLGPGQQASRTITVTPTIAGTFTNAASTSSSEPEETPADNTASEATTVLGAPTIRVSDASVAEGNAGSVNAVFTVSLSAAFPVSASVGYTVTPLTAGPGDFVAATGTLTFAPGTTSLPLSVPVLGDLLAEGNETFLVTLVSSSHGTFADSQGVGTILDDDALPTLSITGASVTEGDAGYEVVLLRVSLSGPTGRPVKVAYKTNSGTALWARDYLPASGVLVFPEGTNVGELALWVMGDLFTEATEAFTLSLSQPENATIATGTATVTIVDNDTTPALAVADVLIREGHLGSRNAIFRVTLSAAAPADVSVNWTTADLTAKAGEDYLPSGGTLTIRKGLRWGTMIVPVLGDLADERNEAFLLSLSNNVGARIVDGQAQGVIWDDDGERDIAIPIASLPYVATRPGRYRLARDLVFAPTQGAAVTVAASRVVLDLDGHTLSGSAGAGTEAFGVLARNRWSITVQNGTVQGFLTGVLLAGPPPYAARFAVRNLRVHSSTYAGIWLEGRGNQVDACEVVGTGGTTALDPGTGAVGISSVGPLPKLTQNQVRDTVAPGGGDAFGIAAAGATMGILSGNLVKNSSSGAATGILVTGAARASVTLNTLDTLDYGIVFTAGASGTCKGNSMSAVATPAMGVTCEP